MTCSVAKMTSLAAESRGSRGYEHEAHLRGLKTVDAGRLCALVAAVLTAGFEPCNRAR